jgi:predicted XRE-type DNA-binding protein
MRAKGRGFTPFRGQVQVGELNRYAKVDEAIVREIRRLAAAGVYQRDIAAQFGVTQSNVSCIVLRKSWDHVA